MEAGQGGMTEACTIVGSTPIYVTFEIDTDQSAFSGSNDFSGLQFGVNPEGAKILIFTKQGLQERGDKPKQVKGGSRKKEKKVW